VNSAFPKVNSVRVDSIKADFEALPIVFIHCPYSNPHPSQMGRVRVKNNYL
jgi:hypothetical protein